MALQNSVNGTEGQKELSKRDRAFLGQLPDDFLRVEEEPSSRQQTSNVQRYKLYIIYRCVCSVLY